MLVADNKPQTVGTFFANGCPGAKNFKCKGWKILFGRFDMGF